MSSLHERLARARTAGVLSPSAPREPDQRQLHRTRPDWGQGNGMAVHNFWHTALMYLTVGDRPLGLLEHDRAALVDRQRDRP